MSKKNQPLTAEEVMEETPQANSQGKTVEELKEIARDLQAQLKQHQETSDQYRRLLNQETTMISKLQGGLEITLLMLPKKEVEKMVADQQKTNQMNGQKADG